MNYDDVLGLDHLKNHLKTTVEKQRVAHAQLFIGEHGYGVLPLALAFAAHLVTFAGKKSYHSSILEHPDVHFVYPVNVTESSSKKPTSQEFLEDWRSFIRQSPYQNLFDWYQHIGIEKKQGLIKVTQAQEILKILSLKSFSGGVKVMIIWCADLMNRETSNKLLKLIEEPPKDTFFILTTSNPDQIIDTIKSRCQLLHFPPLSESVIADALIEQSIESHLAKSIAHQADGDFVRALHLAYHNEDELQFEDWFISWVRSAFRAKGNKAVVDDLVNWSEDLAKQTRELQKRFLEYCLQFFRQALLHNYKANDLVFLKPNDKKFKFEAFSTFITGANIKPIFEAISDAIYHIERNGNAKMIFTDLSFQLTRFLHKKN